MYCDTIRILQNDQNFQTAVESVLESCSSGMDCSAQYRLHRLGDNNLGTEKHLQCETFNSEAITGQSLIYDLSFLNSVHTTNISTSHALTCTLFVIPR